MKGNHRNHCNTRASILIAAGADVEVDVEDVDKLELVLVDVLAGVDELELAGESVLLLRSMLRSMLKMMTN
eukprot:5736855-Amphidinium_carterae.1